MLIKNLKFIKYFFSLAMFVGLLSITGLSLFALSPVAYEDYAKYLSSYNEEAAPNTGARVAGVSADNTSTAAMFTSLLEESGLSYNFTSEDGLSALIQATYTSGKISLSAKQQVNLPLLKISNSGSEPIKYTLGLSYDYLSNDLAPSHIIYGLNNNANGRLIETAKNTYELTLPANETAEIALLRNSTSAEVRYLLEESFQFQVNLDAAEGDSIQRSST